jgi:hypothetical protein
MTYPPLRASTSLQRMRPVNDAIGAEPDWASRSRALFR